MVVYAMVILVANVKVMIFSNIFGFFNLFFIFGSMVLYVFSLYVINKLPSFTAYNEFYRAYMCPNFYFGVILVLGFCSLIDFIFN